MASFADQPIEFAPYIQTMPLEAMAKVGMLKQQQYDAGIEKSRAYLEKVSGLAISHPGILNHLQGKLDTIKTQLKSLASADFSNQQIVNNVGSLAREVYRDPIIQNGVKSTAAIKDEYGYIDEARKKGKSSPLNESYFASKVGEWQNNPNLNTPFTDRYSPYIDLPKKWVDVMKAITPDEKVQQIPFETFVDPTTGQVVSSDKIARVMTEAGVKGIDAGKIENAIRATLTPDDIQQMRINAWGQFRDVTPQDLGRVAKENYDKQRIFLEKTLSDAEKELNNLSSNPDEYAKAVSEIASIKEALGQTGKPGKLQKNLEEQLADINKDPEGAKLRIYKDGAIEQFANAFRWKSTSIKYTDSPFEKVRENDRQFQLDMAQYQLGLRKEKREEEKAAFDMYGITPFGMHKGLPTGDGDFDVEEAMLNNASRYTESGSVDQQDLMRYMNKTGPEVDKVIYDYQYGNNGMGNPNAIPKELRGVADSYIKNMSAASAIQAKIDEARRKAFATADIKDNFVVTTSDGRQLTFTPGEVRAVENKKRNKIKLVTSQGDPFTGGTSTREDRTDFINSLTPKERELVAYAESPGAPANMDYSVYTSALKKGQEQVDASIKNALRPFAGEWQPYSETINTSEPKVAATWAQIATSILNGQYQDKGTSVVQNKEALESWLADSQNYKDLTYNVVSQGLNRQLWISKGPKETAIINLGPESSAALPLPEKFSPDVYRLKQRVVLGNGHSFIPFGVSSDGFTRHDFKNVRGANILFGNISKIPRTDLYNVEIKIPTSKGLQPFKLDPPMSLENAQRYVNNVSNSELLQDLSLSIKNTNGDQQTIQELIKYLK